MLAWWCQSVFHFAVSRRIFRPSWKSGKFSKSPRRIFRPCQKNLPTIQESSDHLCGIFRPCKNLLTISRESSDHEGIFRPFTKKKFAKPPSLLASSLPTRRQYSDNIFEKWNILHLSTNFPFVSEHIMCWPWQTYYIPLLPVNSSQTTTIETLGPARKARVDSFIQNFL